MSAHKEHFTAKHYLINGAILTALMIATVWAAQIEMGIMNFPVAMAIAITKMLFIVLVFMNVWKSSSLAQLFAASGFFWFLILIAFTFADFSALHHEGTPTTSAIP